MPSELLQYLVVGSYLFGAGSWLFLYKEIRACRIELEKAAVMLAYNRGLDMGLDIDGRLAKVETTIGLRGGPAILP